MQLKNKFYQYGSARTYSAFLAETGGHALTVKLSTFSPLDVECFYTFDVYCEETGFFYSFRTGVDREELYLFVPGELEHHYVEDVHFSLRKYCDMNTNAAVRNAARQYIRRKLIAYFQAPALATTASKTGADASLQTQLNGVMAEIKKLSDFVDRYRHFLNPVEKRSARAALARYRGQKKYLLDAFRALTSAA